MQELAEERAQSGKSLLHEGQSSHPGTHVKNPDVLGRTCNPRTRNAETGNGWSFLPTYLAESVSSGTSEEACLQKQGRDQEDTRVNLQPLTCREKEESRYLHRQKKTNF